MNCPALEKSTVSRFRYLALGILAVCVVSISVLQIASSLGLLGGLLGSLYPALKAARMDPVQALNFE